MDAFVSWTGEDRDVKNVLVQKLTEAGVTCFDSDEHCTSDYSEQCTAAIRNCGVFIVIISDASMKKGYVINEVITARKLSDEGKLNMLVYKITDAPYTDNFEFQLNHLTIVSGNIIERKETLGGKSSIDIIAKRTIDLLKAREDGNPEKPFDVKIPEIDGLKINKTGYFVEDSRTDTFAAIDDAFDQSNVIIMEEFVGFGKRSTIRKYIENHKNSFSTAIQPNNFQGDLRSFFLTDLNFKNLNSARFSNLEGSALIKEKLDILKKLDKNTILVIPNVFLNSQPDEELCQGLLGLDCKIVLLTQNSADNYRDWFPIINLGRMANCHLREMFFHHYGRAAYEEDKENLYTPLDSFFEYIGGHTKTVELTASVLGREMGIMPEDVPNYLAMGGDEGSQLKDRIFSQLSNIVNLERLSDEHNVALLVAACLATPHISERDYRDVLKACGVTNYMVISELDDKRWIDLDLPNQTVSMEPLVAQIVYNKLSHNYAVFSECLKYITNLSQTRIVNSLIGSASGFIDFLNKTEHFVSLIGLEEIAQLISVFKPVFADDSSDSNDILAQKIQIVTDTYPKKECDNVDLEEPITNLEQLRLHAINIFYLTIFPLLKLHTYTERSLFYNYSHDNFDSYGKQMQSEIFGTNVLGFATEELEEDIAYFTSVLEQATYDEDAEECLILAELMSIINAITQRNPQVIDERIDNILAYIDEHPEFLEDSQSSQLFSIAIVCLCNIFFISNAYSSLIVLFERILEVCDGRHIPVACWQLYVFSLRHKEIYNDQLFNAYENVIKNLDKSRTHFKNTKDLLHEKKKTLLSYAEDLALASRFERAEQIFEQAIKIFADNLFDESIISAHTIADSYIRSGDFMAAVEFAKKHSVVALVEQPQTDLSVNAENGLVLLRMLQEFDPCDNVSDQSVEADHTYYQRYSRENHSTLPKDYIRLADLVQQYDFSSLTNQQITEHAKVLQEKARTTTKLQLAPEAFALASEAGYRVLGYRHHYVQYLGALAMVDGKIAEILNGEGKTYTIVLVAFLNALYKERVFVVDSSDFLTHRNYIWMRGVYSLLGLDCRYIDPNDRNNLSEYMCDIYYSTLKSLIFTYLRTEYHPHCTDDHFNMTCILDEADTILVDNALQPLSVVSYKKTNIRKIWCNLAWTLIDKIRNKDNYYVFEKGYIKLLPDIYPLLEETFEFDWADLQHIELLLKIEDIVKDAIWAAFVSEENKNYFIHKGNIFKENKTTGVFELFNTETEFFLRKRHCLPLDNVEHALSGETIIINTITTKDFFKKCKSICGTTATAISFCKEFKEIYKLDYIAIPPQKECIRENITPEFFLYQQEKERQILMLVNQKQQTGQPILICTQSIEESELYSNLLTSANIPHKLLNAKNDAEFDSLVALAGVKNSVLVANALTNRGADIKLGGDPERMTRQELVNMGVNTSGLDEILYSILTKEQSKLKLYNQYHSLLQKNRAFCDQNRQEVIELGGLCVIATSFFAEPRNEQQTIGRAGRQGEPGEAYIFRSIEDASMQKLFGDRYRNMLVSLADDIGGINSKILNNAIETGQKRLHDSMFANVRKTNKNTMYIDDARPDFIGRICALNSERLTLEYIIKEWASSDIILKQLKKLQSGASSCESKALYKLWENVPYLKHIKKKQAPQFMTECISLLVKDLLPEKVSPEIILQRYIINCWEKYINFTFAFVYYSNMSDVDLGNFLMQKRKEMRIEPTDAFIEAVLTPGSIKIRFPE